MSHPWWQTTSVYQVYIRSFSDSNGDGVGDLPGLRQKLPYLADLGVGCVWLSPVHPSPDVDFGYDVADYDGIHPLFGDHQDLDGVIADAHGLGMKVILDGVFNHTSDQHGWFAERPDYYLWRDTPNNWKSTFGGSAWTRRGERHYLHSFAPEQPDLNWRNPAVADAVLASMERWFQRGVDGFRLDVFNCYLKHPELLDNPRSWHPGGLVYGYIGQHHLHDRDHPDLADVLRRMRALADRYDAMLVGETLDERFRYDNARPWVGDDQLHMAFHFRLLHSRWSAARFADAINANDLPWPTWVMSNHDFKRSISRYGNRPERARLLAALQCALRGTPFVYQGEELGQQEMGLARAEILDPPGRRFWPFYKGRDGCRAPMPWTPDGGFTSGSAWLPQRPGCPSVQEQQDDPDSLLNHWRRWLRDRQQWVSQPQTLARAEGAVLRFERGPWSFAFDMATAKVWYDGPS